MAFPYDAAMTLLQRIRSCALFRFLLLNALWFLRHVFNPCRVATIFIAASLNPVAVYVIMFVCADDLIYDYRNSITACNEPYKTYVIKICKLNQLTW